MNLQALILAAIGGGMVLGWPFSLVIQYARRARRWTEVPATLDRLASTCYRVAAQIPAGHTDLADEVNELLSTAEAAARLALALTPNAPGAGAASNPAPGCSPTT